MLRVGLTGGLASGKSAVARVFSESGAYVLEADAIGRALMQPGRPVFDHIVGVFGAGIVAADGSLDRHALAVQAFERGRLAELNAIVHPAVLEAQEQELQRIETDDPAGIAVVESALIFEVARDAQAGGPARPRRFHRMVLVCSPEAVKIERYIARVAPVGADDDARAVIARAARARLAAQIPDEQKAPLCDYVIDNSRSLVLLRREARAVLRALQADAAGDG